MTSILSDEHLKVNVAPGTESNESMGNCQSLTFVVTKALEVEQSNGVFRATRSESDPDRVLVDATSRKYISSLFKEGSVLPPWAPEPGPVPKYVAPATMFTVVEMVLVPSLKETVLVPAFQWAAASRSNFSSVAPELKVKVTEKVPEAVCTVLTASSAVQSISE